MKTIIIFIFILLSASAVAEEKFTVRIEYSDMQKLEILHDLNIELDHRKYPRPLFRTLPMHG